MYDYNSYLSGNRSLLGSQGPGYEYAPQFPSHLRQWQEQNYDTSGIDYFSRQSAVPRVRRRRGYRGPGIGWNGWGNGGVPYRPANGGGMEYQHAVKVGRGMAPPEYSYQPPSRFGFF